MDELLKKVAEIRGMPVSLIERSAKARADKTGTTLQAVLEEWAGESGDTAVAEQPVAPEVADPDPATDTSNAAEEDTGQNQDSAAPISTDDLVQMAADAKRMPAKLILSSAQARATHGGSTLEAVLAEWAGVDLDDLQAATPETAPDETPADDDPEGKAATEATPAPEPESTEAPDVPAAAVAAAAVTTAMSMDELLEKVAEVKGMPASLAKRSAEAKAKKTGEPLESVLAEWAGVDVGAVAAVATPEAETEPEATPEASAAPDGPVDETDESTEDETPGVEIIEPAGASTDDAESGEDTDELPTPRGGYPRWLAAAFLLIPLLAVTYLMVSPNGPDCGSGGQLLVDPVTGEATNCDGSDYGETTADFFAAGGAIYAQCAACHGANGAGGVGPAFSSGAVLETFPIGQCTTQIEWVGIGTAGWPDSTYGANAKPVGGAGLMPGFASALSEQQLAEVALFERVQFGGQELADAEIDCGLVEASAEG